MTARRKSRSGASSAVIGTVLAGIMAAASAGIAATSSSTTAAHSTGNSATSTVTAAASPVRVAAARRAPEALVLPDPTLHPGAVDPSATKARLCSASFHTSDVRPSTTYTSKLKILEFGDGGTIKGPSGRTYTVVGEHLTGTPADYELDHLVSLEVGGNPEDPRNLWMEPWERRGDNLAAPGQGAESKDVVENRLHREVCKTGTLTLKSAQQQIATDWTAAT